MCGVTCVEASNGTLEHHNEDEGATKFFGCVSKLDFFPSIFREEAEAVSLKYTSKTQEEGKKILNQMMHGLGRAWLHLCADRIGPLG